MSQSNAPDSNEGPVFNDEPVAVWEGHLPTPRRGLRLIQRDGWPGVARINLAVRGRSAEITCTYIFSSFDEAQQKETELLDLVGTEIKVIDDRGRTFDNVLVLSWESIVYRRCAVVQGSIEGSTVEGTVMLVAKSTLQVQPEA